MVNKNKSNVKTYDCQNDLQHNNNQHSQTLSNDLPLYLIKRAVPE